MEDFIVLLSDIAMREGGIICKHQEKPSEWTNKNGLVYEVCWDNEFSKKLFSEITFLAR